MKIYYSLLDRKLKNWRYKGLEFVLFLLLTFLFFSFQSCGNNTSFFVRVSANQSYVEFGAPITFTVELSPSDVEVGEAQIDFGDGTKKTLNFKNGKATSTYTYQAVGKYDVKVFVRGNLLSSSDRISVYVNDKPSFSITALSEEKRVKSVFSVSENVLLSISCFDLTGIGLVSVEWGDGISETYKNCGIFTHKFDRGGKYRIKVSVWDTSTFAPYPMRATGEFSISVSDEFLFPVIVVPRNRFQGEVPFSITIPIFIYSKEGVENLFVSWGDGSEVQEISDGGLISSNPPNYIYEALHTYEREGIYTISITVVDSQGNSDKVQLIAFAGKPKPAISADYYDDEDRNIVGSANYVVSQGDSVGLEARIKVFDISNYSVIHYVKFESPGEITYTIILRQDTRGVYIAEPEYFSCRVVNSNVVCESFNFSFSHNKDISVDVQTIALPQKEAKSYMASCMISDFVCFCSSSDEISSKEIADCENSMSSIRKSENASSVPITKINIDMQ